MIKYPYIITPYQKAIDEGLITADTTRRVNNTQTKVILSYLDYETYKPLMTETITPEATEENPNPEPYTIERYATTLEEKAKYIGATIMTQEQCLKDVQKPEWQPINENEKENKK